MSGPKVYDFALGDDPEENRKILSSLSGFFTGYSAKVENNNLVVTVSESSTLTREDIFEKIQHARKLYQEELLFKRNKKEILLNVENRKKQLDRLYIIKTEKIDYELKKIQSFYNTYTNVRITTPFKAYDLRKECEDIANEIKRLNNKKSETKNELSSLKNELDRYLRNVNMTKSLQELNSIRINLNSINFEPFSATYNTEQKKKELDYKIIQLNKFKDFSIKINDEFNKGNLTEYKNRIANVVRNANPYDEKDLINIKDEIDKIKNIIVSLEAQSKINEIKDEIDNNIKELSKTLDEALANLEEINKISSIFNTEMLVIKEANEKLYSEFVNLYEKFNKFEFIRNEYKFEIDKNVKVFKFNQALGDASTKLMFDAAINKLKDVYAKASIDNEKYVEFLKLKEEYEKHFNDIEVFTSNNSEILIKELKKPSSLFFDYMNYDRQKEQLIVLNKELDKLVNELKSQAMLIGIRDLADRNTLFNDGSKNGINNVSYIRKNDKGILFDASTNNGSLTISPKGVILNNGVKTINENELKAYYKNCNWADEVNESFESVGISNLEYQEIEKDIIIDESKYYKCKDYDESIKFLKLAGYSEAEIVELFNEFEEEEPRRKEIELENKKELKW